MKEKNKRSPLAVVACGGSGGHFYPGLAVARKLLQAGCEVILLITEKEIDQVTSGAETGFRVIKVPAIGLTKGGGVRFTIRFLKSYLKLRKLFAAEKPGAVLGMGGFSSAPAVLATSYGRCKAFLHEGNSIPGRANRLVAPFVHTGFVHFPQSASRLHCRRLEVVGMPVRDGFIPVDESGVRGCRMSLGLHPDKPTLLVMGGSQGAHAINQMMIQSAENILRRVADLQIIHLTGALDFKEATECYNKLGIKAIVFKYLTEMELVMGAATAMVSRSGASSMAEIAAMRIPALLIPYPYAADNHQYFNALAYEEMGAAIVMEQDFNEKGDKAVDKMEFFEEIVAQLLLNKKQQDSIKRALAEWQEHKASIEIARRIIEIAFPQEKLMTDWNSEPVF